MTTKPSKIVQFTEKELKKISANRDGITYSDEGCTGLKARAAVDGEVTFTVIRRIGGKKVPKILGTYDPEHFTVEKARKAAGSVKFAIKNPKLMPRVTKTLDQMIDYYAEQRLAGNSAIEVRKEDGLAADWPAQAKKLRAMCKAILHRPIETLEAADIDKSKADHLRAIAKKKNKPVPAGTKLNDKPLRQPCSALRQILTFAINLGWQETPILIACKTRKYKKRPRFLLPGEWQRVAAALDYLPDSGGMVIRFLLATGARLETALQMKWADIDEATNTAPPVREWRTRVKGEHEALIYLTGEALRIIDHFAEHKKREEAKDSEYKRETVFTQEVIAMWRKHGTYYQRQIEAVIGTVPFHRHDLRRTLATYLKYAGLSQGFVSVALTHSFGTQGGAGNDIEAAQATATYTNDDRIAGDLLGDNSDLSGVDAVDMFEVVRAHVRVQAIFKHIEIGKRSAHIAFIETKLRGGPNTNAMILQHNMDRNFLTVKSPEEHAVWVEKAKLAEWGANVKVALNAKLAALAKKQRVRSIAKAKAAAAQATQKSGNVVMATMQHEATRSAT